MGWMGDGWIFCFFRWIVEVGRKRTSHHRMGSCLFVLVVRAVDCLPVQILGKKPQKCTKKNIDHILSQRLKKNSLLRTWYGLPLTKACVGFRRKKEKKRLAGNLKKKASRGAPGDAREVCGSKPIERDERGGGTHSSA